MAKHDKYAQLRSKKINSRSLKFPAGTSKINRDYVEFVAAIIAKAHAENPDENWLYRCEPWVREAIATRG